jgi:hypothetical protein
MNQAKHFFWEIDSIMFPDYYDCINKPIMIANVASNLIDRAYGDNNDFIYDSFYHDLRQISVNCYAYNTEITANTAQAHKLYQATWRHYRRCVFIFVCMFMHIDVYEYMDV